MSTPIEKPSGVKRVPKVKFRGPKGETPGVTPQREKRKSPNCARKNAVNGNLCDHNLVVFLEELKPGKMVAQDFWTQKGVK